ncbi:DUF4382 domain-containing protein [uncultured Eudoraea sp.]|uniref:DUF4382 domain-containing protein n=1 Tax=uncultured Eudoraea sp. TaxID=1035614 RepID=UPI0026113DEF|nr:DUF4382 domain-containing protein [uncultured Eudoraea sp.]
MKTKFFTSFFIILSIFLLGCSEDLNNETSTGRLTVRLTDAPFPYDLISEANVTIFKVDARYKGDSMEGDENNKEEGYSFVVLMEEERDFNLLNLTNGITETLVDIDVPVGSYDLIRIYVKGVNVVLKDESKYDLKVPSGEQTGIKVFIKPSILVSGELSSDLLLDFDVGRSFIPKGNIKNISGINGFNFKPVIKACNMSFAGSVSGLVSTMMDGEIIGLENATVSVFETGTLDPIMAPTDENGNYTVMGLNAGLYDVMVELKGYKTQTIKEVTIVAGNKIIQDFDLVPVP